MKELCNKCQDRCVVRRELDVCCNTFPPYYGKYFSISADTETASVAYPDPVSIMDIQHLKPHSQHLSNDCSAPGVA